LPSAAARCTVEQNAPPRGPRKGQAGGKIDLHFVEAMQRRVIDHRIDRHSYVIAIGGGALLDAVGLVAATTHRGVRHIRVPTTVLAQNDSGVGVKNGVNLRGVKNFVGTFAPPFAVLNDLELIETPARPRQDRRHGRGGEGGADPRRRILRWLERTCRRPRAPSSARRWRP
jgi:glycerol dehydrogenase-like iron-containing ADH family enzyme